MRQLSSNWTMVFRIFIPTLWLAFFGTFLISVLLSDKTSVGAVSLTSLKVGLTLFVALFAFIFWKTVFRLKRIDADGSFFYITNFFNAVSYPHVDIEKIELSKGIAFTFGTLVLKGSGRFGSRILFLCSRQRLAMFIAENPKLMDLVVEM